VARQKLIDTPNGRIVRLRQLISQLETGKYVQNRNIETVLDDEQRRAFRRDMEDAKKNGGANQELMPYPAELDRYLELVDEGTREYGMGERHAGKPSAHKYYHASEVKFGHAQEALSEALGVAGAQTRAAIEMWLDRPLTWGDTGELDIGSSPSSMPRKVGSRSKYAERTTKPMAVSAFDVVKGIKIDHLRRALAALGATQNINLSRVELAKLLTLTKLVRR